MDNIPSIYLDNAATSWPKPDSVIEAMTEFYRDIGAAAGRGSSVRSTLVDRTIAKCRAELARLINAEASQIVFCFNGTDALNMAINGLIWHRDNVVTTMLEHNSVLRPLYHWAGNRDIELDVVGCRNGMVDLLQLKNVIQADTRLCCASHASNVTGVIQPIEQIADLCRKTETLLVVDAAQSVGHIPIDFRQMGCDILAASGHKGLLGPLGTGFLCLSPRAAELIRPTRFGGTGTESESLTQPDELPYRLEAGNLNVGGIFGLLEGIRFVAGKSIETIQQHEAELSARLVDALSGMETIDLYGVEDVDPSQRTGVVSFNIRDVDPQSAAAILDSEFGIQVRAGLHCAPLIHKTNHAHSRGGTIRVSPGVFNSIEDIDAVINAVQEIASHPV